MNGLQPPLSSNTKVGAPPIITTWTKAIIRAFAVMMTVVIAVILGWVCACIICQIFGIMPSMTMC